MTIIFIFSLVGIWIYAGWLIVQTIKTKRDDKPKQDRPFQPTHGSSKTSQPEKRGFYRPRK